MITLENWSVVDGTKWDPYTPPEAMRSSLHGRVYGHPKFEDGTEVTTSYIKDIKGRVVTTHSGSKYLLGKVDKRYADTFPESDLTGKYPIKFKEDR